MFMKIIDNVNQMRLLKCCIFKKWTRKKKIWKKQKNLVENFFAHTSIR